MNQTLNELKTSWKSLSTLADQSGWRGMKLASTTSTAFHAAIKFPTKEKAVWFEFSGAIEKIENQPPSSSGFSVELTKKNSAQVRFAVSKLEEGPLDVFETMVMDLWDQTSKFQGTSAAAVTHFLARIRSWQDFMKLGSQTLSEEEELGLWGELLVLQTMVEKFPEKELLLVNSWVGPLKKDQDFRIAKGAFEVKTSSSPLRFVIKAASSKQFDASEFSLLALGAVKVSVNAKGKTLPALVDSALSILTINESKNCLKNSLLAAGYIDTQRQHYSRSFLLSNLTFYKVDDSFPKLPTEKLDPAIVKITYEIDLALLKSPQISLKDAMQGMNIENGDA